MNKLPEKVQSLISASNHLNNHRKVVEELVYNSLDAGATSVAIRINIEDNTIQVIDNGCGVSKNDFKFIGQNFMTSKFIDLTNLSSAPNNYGFRGQFIANLVHLSKNVKITSRHENSEETWMKLFENGKERQLSILSSTRPSKGTTVEVQGFCTIAIKINFQKRSDLQSIKLFLEHLSLVHCNVSLSLRDDSKNEIIFKMHKGRDIYQTLCNLYNIKKEDVDEFTVEKNHYKVRGLIGKKNIECERNYIFLNGKYITAPSKLHNTLNIYMKKYFLHLNDRKIRKVKGRNDDGDVVYQKKMPFYFVFLKCPYKDYDISNSPKQSVLEFKDWNEVNRLLEKLIKFSAGNLNVVPINEKGKEVRHFVESSTREHVKEIMNKILGNHLKKPGPCHVQNGIKGKQIKRKSRKLHTSEKSVFKENNHKKINNYNHNSRSFHDNKDIKNAFKSTYNKNEEHSILKSDTNHGRSQPTENNSKSKSKLDNFGKIFNSKFRKVTNHDNFIVNETKRRNKNNMLKENKSKKPRLLGHDLINKFEMETESVKRRGGNLNDYVKNLLNKKKDINSEIHESEKVQYSNFTINNKNVSIRQKVNEVIIKSYLTKPNIKSHCYINEVFNANTDTYHVKSNYELLETVNKSQKHPGIMHIIENDLTTSSLHKKISYEDCNRCIDMGANKTNTDPVATFQSHHYLVHNNETVKKNPDIRKEIVNSKNVRNFITKQSKDKFGLSSYKRSRTKITKERSTNSNAKFGVKIKKLFKQTSKLLSLKHQLMGKTSQTSYTYTNFTNSNYHNLTNVEEKQLSSRTYSIKCPANMNIEETSTNCLTYYSNTAIKNQNIHPTYIVATSSGTCNSNVIEQQFLVGTYTVKDDNVEESIEDHNIGIDNDFLDKNYIFVSHSQDKNRSENREMLDPITVCETILSSQEKTNNKPQNILLKNLNNDDVQIHNEKNVTKNTVNYSKNYIVGDDCVKQVAHEGTLELSHYFSLPDNGCSMNNDHTETQIQNISFEKQFNKRQEDNLNIKNNENNAFNFKQRPRFVPKGMSPIFDKNEMKNKSPCSLSKDYYEDDMYDNFMNNIRNNAVIFRPEIQEAQNVTTRAIEKVSEKLNKDNSSLKFDGHCLKYAKVLGQVDDKFIAAIIRGGCNNEIKHFLVLFDQHAVHERIILENNLSEYVLNKQWISINTENVKFKIAKEDVLFLHNYRDKFEQLGLQWTVLNSNEIVFHAIPAAILGKNLREADRVNKAVRCLITEEINIIRMQSGCTSLYPKTIMDLVFSEACRYAIMFGEKLSMSRCVELLQQLSACKTPFQCAHGRPVMAVITEIKRNANDYNAKIHKVMEWKVKTQL